MITRSVKTKKQCVSRKMFQIEFKFSNWSKELCLNVSEPTGRLAAQGKAYALRNQQGKQAFAKEIEKTYMCKRNINL